MTPTKGTFTTEKGSCAPSIRFPQGPSRPARFSKIYTPQLLTAGPRPFSGDAPAAPQYVRREDHSTNCSHPVSTLRAGISRKLLSVSSAGPQGPSIPDAATMVQHRHRDHQNTTIGVECKALAANHGTLFAATPGGAPSVALGRCIHLVEAQQAGGIVIENTPLGLIG